MSPDYIVLEFSVYIFLLYYIVRIALLSTRIFSTKIIWLLNYIIADRELIGEYCTESVVQLATNAPALHTLLAGNVCSVAHNNAETW